MKIEPLSKEIHSKCKEHGVEQIILRFQGGNDEGHLYVETNPYNSKMESDIEDWAWTVYEYNGAGDGNDYGDTITYDLVKGEVSRDEWYQSPQHINHEPTKLKVSKE